MASEFRINSSSIESKINQLLPSQGGQGAGVDFSASTMVIPIIDLTESAEGSGLRQDLQSALSHLSTPFGVVNTTTTIISTTGYFRILGAMSCNDSPDASSAVNISITDGATSKILIDGRITKKYTSDGAYPILPFDFIVFLKAGDSVTASSGSTASAVRGSTRQIATITGELTDP
jgi:hypothetical protein